MYVCKDFLVIIIRNFDLVDYFSSITFVMDTLRSASKARPLPLHTHTRVPYELAFVCKNGWLTIVFCRQPLCSLLTVCAVTIAKIAKFQLIDNNGVLMLLLSHIAIL